MFDVCIVGAGVCGIALAYKLALLGKTVVLVEQSDAIVSGASGGNSGIVHCGFDASPSKPLEFGCVKSGFHQWQRVLRRAHGDKLRHGALLVAKNEQQVLQLDEVLEKARHNGISNTEKVDAEFLRINEPLLDESVLAAIRIPDEIIVDSFILPAALLQRAIINGVQLKLNFKVEKIEKLNCFQLTNDKNETIKAKQLINCCGLFADFTEKLIDPEKPIAFEVKPRLGQFIVFPKESGNVLNYCAILPMPTKRTKGILIFKSFHNQVVVGPTALDVNDRIAPHPDEIVKKELFSIGLNAFPCLSKYSLSDCYSYVGLRPATTVDDYILQFDRETNCGMVASIRSTGLTACLGIADFMIQKMCDDVDVSLSNSEESLLVESIRSLTAVISSEKAKSSANLCEHISLDVSDERNLDLRVVHPLTKGM